MQFKFKQFNVLQEKSAMKVNTDSILLGTWADGSDKNRILDIGTGTGLLALILAQRTTDSKIHGVEIDREAYEEALHNFGHSPWPLKLFAHHAAIQDFQSTEKFDLIICNPPFFTGGTLSANQQKNTAKHTAKLPTIDLLRATQRLLKPSGKFSVILPFIEGLRFIEMANQFGFCLWRRTDVRMKKEKVIERLLLEFGLRECDAIEDNELIVLKSDKRNDYTDEFWNFVKDFYV